MPFPLDPVQRLLTYYSGGPISVANPGGFDADGHRQNFVPALRDVADVAVYVGGVGEYIEEMRAQAAIDFEAAGTYADEIEAAAALAAANSASAVRNELSIRAMSLLLAEMRGDRMNMLYGIADPFNDTSDVALGSSAGYTHDPASYVIGGQPTATSVFALVAAAVSLSGVTLSGLSAAGGFPMSNATDASNSTYFRSSATGTGVIGDGVKVDFGGSPKAVRRLRFQNGGANNAVPDTVNIVTSTNGTTWTVLSGPHTTRKNQFDECVIFIPSSVGPKRGWGVVAATGAPTGQPWEMTDISFNEASPGSTIVSNAFASLITPATARIALQLGPSDTFTANTDLIVAASRDGGTTYTDGVLAKFIDLTDGTSVYDTGPFALTAQPSGTSMKYKIRTTASLMLLPAGIVFQWSP